MLTSPAPKANVVRLAFERQAFLQKENGTSIFVKAAERVARKIAGRKTISNCRNPYRSGFSSKKNSNGNPVKKLAWDFDNWGKQEYAASLSTWIIDQCGSQAAKCWNIVQFRE